ncbi:MAG: 30S ribosomal protein S6 [Mariprofundaceae bacterium]|nr:30S ribosomal protein S6 [Mariprofundaceae bacterium]
MYYETVFIVNPDVSKENTEELTDALVKRVEKASGRIVKREYWGSRPLAYQIAKRKRGHYVLLVTDGEVSAVQSLEEGLRLEERVLRFLTTRLQELSDEPSPLLRRQTKSAEATKSEEKPAEEKPAGEKAVEEKTEPTAAVVKDDVATTPEQVETKPAEKDVATEAAGDATT